MNAKLGRTSSYAISPAIRIAPFAALGLAVASVATIPEWVGGDTALKQTFADALERQSAPLKQLAKGVPVSGSEDYWLSAARDTAAMPATKAVAIGDNISMTLGGVNRTFKVASVAELSPVVTEVDTGARDGRFVMVTAHDAAEGSARLVRFVMEVDRNTSAATNTPSGRAL
jgi:hypothetical protein